MSNNDKDLRIILFLLLESYLRRIKVFSSNICLYYKEVISYYIHVIKCIQKIIYAYENIINKPCNLPDRSQYNSYDDSHLTNCYYNLSGVSCYRADLLLSLEFLNTHG